MTVIEAINRIDGIKPNTFSVETKIQWLSEIDGKIRREVFECYEEDEGADFAGYKVNDGNRNLLVDAPYDDIYIKWMEANIDYSNGEYGRYNNAMSMFNNKFSEFWRMYNRTHRAKNRKIKYW